METFGTPIGVMKVLEVYLYYDRPYLFSCIDIMGSVYMAHLINDDDTAEFWMMVPMSKSRLERVRSGQISIRESVINAETEWVWVISTPFDGSQGRLERKRCDELKELKLLPGEDYYLHLEERHLPELELNAGDEAQRSKRDVLFFALNNGSHTQTIPASHLGSVLMRTQGLITSLSYRGGAQKGPIPKTISDSSTLHYTGEFAASFGFKLESSPADLAGTCTNDAFLQLFELINAGSNQKQLLSILSRIEHRSAIRYRLLLEAFQLAGVSVKLNWGSPVCGEREAKLKISEIQDMIQLLDAEVSNVTQTYNMHGDLIGVLTDKQKKRSSFEFMSNEGIRYKGSLGSDLFEQVGNKMWFKVPANNVEVTIEETIEINPITNEDKVYYELINVKGAEFVQ